jgi:hypothetical protein
VQTEQWVEFDASNGSSDVTRPDPWPPFAGDTDTNHCFWDQTGLADPYGITQPSVFDKLLSMRSTVAVSLAAAAAAMMLAACSAPAGPDGTQGTAIQSHPYMDLPGEAPTGTIIDFAGLLGNSDGASFRVRSVRMISPSGPGIRVTIRALAPSRDNGGTFAYFQGDLAKCPKRADYKLRPVARIVEPPHGQSDWRLLVSVVFTKPGRYHLYLLKVDYVEDGERHCADRTNRMAHLP